MLQSKTTNKSQTWAALIRARVGQTISHNGQTYVNKTGKNSEPGVGFDWDYISSFSSFSKPYITVNGNPFTLDKSPANSIAGELEAGDLAVMGWWDETEYWIAAKYLGGDKDTKANWSPFARGEELD